MNKITRSLPTVPFVLTILLTIVCTPLEAQRTERPNVVFIMIDDLGWMDVGYREGSPYRTPNIDRLASQGMRFPDAYASQTVCSPTRAAVMAGKSPARLHLTAHIPGRPSGEHKKPKNKPLPAKSIMQLPLEEVTLAERFKQAGYDTAFFGKWHLAGSGWAGGERNPTFYPDKQGFDLNVAGCEMGSPPSYFSPYKNPRLDDGSEGEYLTNRLAQEVIRFLRQSKERDRPFFATFWPYTVHTPIHNPPDTSVKKYRGREKVRNARYAAMVEAMDRAIGRVLRTLQELEQAKNTIVVFTSDNGGYSNVTDNSPLRAGKGYLYEGGIRVPLIVRWPGNVPSGEVNRTPVVTHDLHATLLDAADLERRKGESPDSYSLLPLLTGNGSYEREAVYFHYPNYSNMGNQPSGAIRMGDYKLIEFFNEESVELYNLEKDISESNDLSDSMPDRTRRMLRRLHRWRDRGGALMPKPRENK